MHAIWNDLKNSRIMQAGFFLLVFSGLAEACDQLGAVDLTNMPVLGKHAPAIIAGVGVAKVIFRALAMLLSAYKAQEAKE